MLEKKYQIFLSSTYEDLKEERDSIIKAILELYHIPIGMEMFSAEDEDQWEIIRRTIDVSDYYILILGLRYGSKTSSGISFTQKEYEYAMESKVPILAFVMNEEVSLPKNKRDDDLSDIRKFRNMVLQNSKMAQFWDSKDQLIKNISISLIKQMAHKPRVGWTRTNYPKNQEIMSTEISELSRENRELRAKLFRLEKRTKKRAPKLEVSVDNPIVDKKFSSFDAKEINIPKKITYDEIDPVMKHYIKEEHIEKYNRSFPRQSEVDNYLEQLEIYYLEKNYLQPLSISISNNGSIKAKNIHIDIVFPNSIVVHNSHDEINIPISPYPMHPADLLNKKRNEKAIEKQLNSSIKDIHDFMEMFSPVQQDNTSKSTAPIPLTAPSLSQSQNLNGNTISVSLENLMHTRNITLENQYLFAPLKPGRHTVQVHIICEELEELHTQEIHLEVQNSDS